MKTIVLKSESDFSQIIRTGIVLVDFTAPWCAPCREQSPIIQDLAGAFTKQAVMAEINIDENQGIAPKLGIHSIPTLIIFKNGREIQRFVGLQDFNTLSTAIENIVRGQV